MSAKPMVFSPRPPKNEIQEMSEYFSKSTTFKEVGISYAN